MVASLCLVYTSDGHAFLNVIAMLSSNPSLPPPPPHNVTTEDDVLLQFAKDFCENTETVIFIFRILIASQY